MYIFYGMPKDYRSQNLSMHQVTRTALGLGSTNSVANVASHNSSPASSSTLMIQNTCSDQPRRPIRLNNKANSSIGQRTVESTVAGAEAEPSYHRSETSHGRERRFRLASSSFRVYDQLI